MDITIVMSDVLKYLIPDKVLNNEESSKWRKRIMQLTKYFLNRKGDYLKQIEQIVKRVYLMNLNLLEENEKKYKSDYIKETKKLFFYLINSNEALNLIRNNLNYQKYFFSFVLILFQEKKYKQSFFFCEFLISDSSILRLKNATNKLLYVKIFLLYQFLGILNKTDNIIFEEFELIFEYLFKKINSGKFKKKMELIHTKTHLDKILPIYVLLLVWCNIFIIRQQGFQRKYFIENKIINFLMNTNFDNENFTSLRNDVVKMSQNYIKYFEITKQKNNFSLNKLRSLLNQSFCIKTKKISQISDQVISLQKTKKFNSVESQKKFYQSYFNYQNKNQDNDIIKKKEKFHSIVKSYRSKTISSVTKNKKNICFIFSNMNSKNIEIKTDNLNFNSNIYSKYKYLLQQRPKSKNSKMKSLNKTQNNQKKEYSEKKTNPNTNPEEKNNKKSLHINTFTKFQEKPINNEENNEIKFKNEINFNKTIQKKNAFFMISKINKKKKVNEPLEKTNFSRKESSKKIIENNLVKDLYKIKIAKKHISASSVKYFCRFFIFFQIQKFQSFKQIAFQELKLFANGKKKINIFYNFEEKNKLNLIYKKNSFVFWTTEDSFLVLFFQNKILKFKCKDFFLKNESKNFIFFYKKNTGLDFKLFPYTDFLITLHNMLINQKKYTFKFYKINYKFNKRLSYNYIFSKIKQISSFEKKTFLYYSKYINRIPFLNFNFFFVNKNNNNFFLSVISLETFFTNFIKDISDDLKKENNFSHENQNQNLFLQIEKFELNYFKNNDFFFELFLYHNYKKEYLNYGEKVFSQTVQEENCIKNILFAGKTKKISFIEILKKKTNLENINQKIKKKISVRKTNNYHEKPKFEKIEKKPIIYKYHNYKNQKCFINQKIEILNFYDFSNNLYFKKKYNENIISKINYISIDSKTNYYFFKIHFIRKNAFTGKKIVLYQNKKNSLKQNSFSNKKNINALIVSGLFDHFLKIEYRKIIIRKCILLKNYKLIIEAEIYQNILCEEEAFILISFYNFENRFKCWKIILNNKDFVLLFQRKLNISKNKICLKKTNNILTVSKIASDEKGENNYISKLMPRFSKNESKQNFSHKELNTEAIPHLDIKTSMIDSKNSLSIEIKNDEIMKKKSLNDGKKTKILKYKQKSSSKIFSLKILKQKKTKVIINKKKGKDLLDYYLKKILDIVLIRRSFLYSRVYISPKINFILKNSFQRIDYCENCIFRSNQESEILFQFTKSFFNSYFIITIEKNKVLNKYTFYFYNTSTNSNYFVNISFNLIDPSIQLKKKDNFKQSYKERLLEYFRDNISITQNGSMNFNSVVKKTNLLLFKKYYHQNNIPIVMEIYMEIDIISSAESGDLWNKKLCVSLTKYDTGINFIHDKIDLELCSIFFQNDFKTNKDFSLLLNYSQEISKLLADFFFCFSDKLFTVKKKIFNEDFINYLYDRKKILNQNYKTLLINKIENKNNLILKMIFNRYIIVRIFYFETNKIFQFYIYNKKFKTNRIFKFHLDYIEKSVPFVNLAILQRDFKKLGKRIFFIFKNFININSQ